MHPLKKIQAPPAAAGKLPADVQRPLLAMFWAYAIFVVYATTLPFKFTVDPATLAMKRQWINWDPTQLVSGEPTPISDLVSNIFFFMPLGILGMFLRGGRSTRRSIIDYTVFGFMLSLFVETLQFFTPMRNPATSDLISNTLGALAGALLAAFLQRRMLSAPVLRLRAWAQREPLLLILIGFALLLALRGLVPLDLTVSLSELKKAVKSARLDPFTDAVPWVRQCEVMLSYGLLSSLAFVLSGRLRPGSILKRYFICAGAICVFAFALEFGQLFVRSRVPTVQDALAACWGALAGPFAVVVFGKETRLEKRWRLVAALYLLAMCFEALYPYSFSFDVEMFRQKINKTSLLPYYTHYFKATVEAVTEFLDRLLMFLPMGFVLAVPASYRLKHNTLRVGISAGLACALLALVLEVAQLAIPRRYADMSDVVTASLGGCLGGFVWAWYMQVRNRAESLGLSVPASSSLSSRLDRTVA